MTSFRLPFISFVLFFFGLGTWELLRWSSKQQQAFLQTELKLYEALDFSKRKILAVTESLAMEKTLAQNVSWRLLHSVQGILTAHLQNPFVSEISLWGLGCKLISKAGQSPVELSCPQEEIEKIAAAHRQIGAGFHVSKDRFEFLRSTPSGFVASTVVKLPLLIDDHWILVQMHLDSEWKKQFPDLNKALERHQYEIDQRQSDADEAKQALRLRLGDSFKHKVLSFLWDDAHHASLERSVAIFFGFALFSLSIWVVQIYRAHSRTQNAVKMSQEKMRDLISQLLSDSDFATPKLKAQLKEEMMFDRDREQATILERFKSEVACFEKLVFLLRRLDSDFKHEKRAIEDHRRIAEVKILELENRLSKTCAAQVLVEKQQDLMTAITTQFKTFRSHLDDLATILEASQICSTKQVARLREWQRFILDKGARKFIRSLSETPGQKNGQTALDEEIELVCSQAETHLELALAGSKVRNLLTDWFSTSYSISVFWDNLLHHKYSEHLGQDFSQWIEYAQKWAVAAAPKSPFAREFVNDYAKGIEVDSLAQGTWMLFLLHIYQFYLKLSEGVPAQLQTTLRLDGKKIRFALECTEASCADRGSESQRQSMKKQQSLEDSLQLHKPMLEKLGVNVLLFPSDPGHHRTLGPVIICSWMMEQKNDPRWDHSAPYGQESLREIQKFSASSRT